jgi:predicted Zn-dependent peptidase
MVKFTLSNNVRVLVEPVDYVQSVAVGLSCKTGSRHEHEHEGGISHLIEHMVFKGTPKRTAKQIAEDIEGRGGTLNAFTDKEMTCYYFRSLAEDVATGLDVISDFVLNPLLDPQELEKEKGVVLEEIKRSEDDPAEHVHELHYINRWGNHPLGNPVIGTPESVSSFSAENLKSYLNRQYIAENVVLSVAGNVKPEHFRDLAEEKLKAFEAGTVATEPTRPAGRQSTNEISQDIEQVHFCIGTDACSLYDFDEIYVLSVLDGILGGGMSSRLFQEIREKRGLVYSVGSYCLNYSSGGAFTVYGGTNKNAWAEVQTLVRKEFDKLMQGDISIDELEKVKQNISGHLVLGLEAMSSRMMRMTRQELFYKRNIPVEETLSQIKAVTIDNVVKLANKLFDERLISTTAIGPF